MDGKGNKQRQDVFARPVRAGRRTYFFDVKQTRKGDLFLTITESKRVLHKKKKDDGKDFHYEKHKIFLYKEDFEKFHEAFKEVVDFVWDNVDESIEKGGLKQDDFNDDQTEGKSPDHDDSTAEGNASEDSSASNAGDETDDLQEQAGSREEDDSDKSDKAFTDVSFEDLDENNVSDTGGEGDENKARGQ
jgi:hypothetical protein